jgi:hypothetical protein
MYVAYDNFTENLKLTLDYMNNTVIENLWNKVLQKYKTFQKKQNGGSLFFKLTMNQLFFKYRTCSEGISRASGNIQYWEYSGRGGYEGYVTDSERDQPPRADQKNPQDMATTLFTIMHTSSVDEFNKVFTVIEVHKTLYDLNQSSTEYVKCFHYSANTIISVTEAQYLKFFKKGKWAGATTT